MEKQFQRLMADNEREHNARWRQFVKRNPADEIADRGAVIEYDAERDYLYWTVGDMQQGGMVIDDSGGIYIIADPETLDFVGIEIPFFMEKVNNGLLDSIYSKLAQLLKRHDAIYLPGVGERREYSRKLVEALVM